MKILFVLFVLFVLWFCFFGREGYYKKACDAGVMKGCNNLGSVKFVKGDLKAAGYYFKKSCDSGLMEGCVGLGQLKEHQGDKKAAGFYYKKACDSGDMKGCIFLGYQKENQGDLKAAGYYFKKSCDSVGGWSCDLYRKLKKEAARKPAPKPNTSIVKIDRKQWPELLPHVAYLDINCLNKDQHGLPMGRLAVLVTEKKKEVVKRKLTGQNIVLTKNVEKIEFMDFHFHDYLGQGQIPKFFGGTRIIIFEPITAFVNKNMTNLETLQKKAKEACT